MQTESQTEITLDNYIKGIGLEHIAKFVPFSKSRNAAQDHPSLNWEVTIKKGNQSLTTDYMQGIGHIPGTISTWDQGGHKKAYQKLVAEEGKYNTNLPKFTNGKIDWWASYNTTSNIFRTTLAYKPLPQPLLKDVLYSLVLDSDVLNYPTFEDWADCFGYDTNSRNAEKIYKDCLSIALKLNCILSQEELSTLRELYQDY